MLKSYRKIAVIFRNGEEVDSQGCGYGFAQDALPADYTDVLTWENLDEWYRKNGLNFPGNYMRTKRGRILSFFHWIPGEKNLRDVKEWKEPLNISVEFRYTEWKPTINDLLNWRDIDTAIQYLNDHGLKIK